MGKAPNYCFLLLGYRVKPKPSYIIIHSKPKLDSTTGSMQGTSSAMAGIQGNHQTIYDTGKIQTIFCHCEHTVKTPNYLLPVLGYGESPNFLL